MKKCALLSAVFVLILFPALVPAQTQPGQDAAKRDIWVILDVSGSMNEERKFVNVQDYLEEEVIGGLLQTGDSFTLIAFGNSAADRFSRTIDSDAAKAALRDDLRKLEADDDYTDIGIAMEKLAELLERRREPGARQLILFITDGKNTPPPQSPYAGKDLSLDERFRSIGEKISKGGWFLYVIGIGSGTDAEKIARAVEGSVYQNTGTELSDLRLDAYAEKVDEEAALREAAAAAAGETIPPAENTSALPVFLTGAAAALSVPAPVLAAAAVLVLILFAVLLVFLIRAFLPVTLTLSDGKDTLERKLVPFGGLTLNSAAAALDGIGGADAGLFRIERSFSGLRLRVLDGGGFADKSSYGKAGTYPLRNTELQLKNGRKITIIAG
ncbi:MAG: VWA domain-containing protein [Treponema sp.]|jgi:Mg-chelatase subunit ChlD|nr:VWA domain-containing protein [Treponema sp.]